MDKVFLKELLSQPTAPFRESHVIRTLIDYVDSHGVPYFRDPVGNIIVGVSTQEEYTELVHFHTQEPLRIFMAHMDHPGFHGVRWVTPKELEVRWYGGTPKRHLNGARVWLASVSGVVGEGVLAKAKLNSAKTALATSTVKLKEPLIETEREPHGLFGGFGFRAPVWEKQKVLYTKAADDLVGSFAIATLAVELKRKHQNFIGLLTRAEEVGFIGAIGHFELGWLRAARRPILCVSLETSRQLAGAEIGKGPVVRLGDRATPFDSGALQVFTELAKRVLPGKHQRRIMDGGTCEATAATAFGFPAIGISVPLGNYHNQSFEGGPDSRGALGPAPEFVHLKDIEGMLMLCRGLLESGLNWDDPWRGKLHDLQRVFRESEELLKLA